jgi:hypothetical protein
LISVESSGKGDGKEWDGLGTIPELRARWRVVHIFSGASPGYLCTDPGSPRGKFTDRAGVRLKLSDVFRGGSTFFLCWGFALKGGFSGQFWGISVLFTVFVYI